MMTRIIAICFSAIAPLLWGGMYAFSRLLMYKINPFALGESRLILAGLFYILMVIVTTKKTPMPLKIKILATGIGAMGVGGTSALQLYGTYLTSAHLAALVLSITPLLLLISMRIILGIKIRLPVILMTLSSVIGLVIASGAWSSIQETKPIGFVVLLVAAVLWVLYSTLVQPLFATYSAWSIMLYSTLGGLAVLTPLSWRSLGTIGFVLYTPTSLLMVLYVGILSTGVAYLFWNTSILYAGPNLPALMYFLQPLIATILGVILLHERLTLNFIVGGIEMIASVIIGVIFHYRFQSKSDTESMPKYFGLSKGE